jgi:hypothetical protein
MAMFRRPRAPAWQPSAPRQRRVLVRKPRAVAATSLEQQASRKPPTRFFVPTCSADVTPTVAPAVATSRVAAWDRPTAELPANERRSGTRPRLVVASEGPLVVVGPTPTPPPVVVQADDPPPPSSRRALIGVPRPRQRTRRFARAAVTFVLFASALLFIATRTTDVAPLRTLSSWSSALQASMVQVSDAARATLRSPSDVDDDGDFAGDEDDAFADDVAPADAPRLKMDGHSSVPGGIVVVPKSFHTTDGTYDLIVHFHGNTAVVKESVEVANLNAMVAMINLGVGSAPYEEAYAVPGTWEKLLTSIHRAVRDRGVREPKLRRVALSGWSAGYGAISTILQVRRGREDLDAILMLDGIHCGFEGNGLNPRQLAPFATAAKRAAAGSLLFSITHSAIDPKAYASTTATADYLLAAVDGSRVAPEPAPKYLSLESMKGAVAKALEKKMEPTSEATKGRLIVRGYKGEEPEHHMAHLFQMGATVLPDLVARWQ